MHYTFRCPNVTDHYLHIELEIDDPGDGDLFLQLPAWRPGRYELQNFAKNVRSVRALRADGQPLPIKKIGKDRWHIRPQAEIYISIHYQYYANQLDAGGTFIDNDQWYINPCTCCMYVEGREHEEHEIALEIPQDFALAGGWSPTGPHSWSAPNFDTLADCPFIVSNALKHRDYEVAGTKFNLWFMGWKDIPWDKIMPAFKAFTRNQIEAFGAMTVEEYHFLYEILPTKKYHGVEHLNSTVIVLGPEEEMESDEDLWENFLGVSSHELYHTWNIKSIRPAEMLPYDLTQEQYFETGYVAEGVTTYKGDLWLAQSGVFNWNQFKKTQEQNLQRHSDTSGNLYTSVAESSFDLWLDGYALGVPNRKVSIYSEGALISLMLDLIIRKNTEGQRGLEHVMRRLYHEFALHGKGYTTDDYRELCRLEGGGLVDTIFARHVYGLGYYWDSLDPLLNAVGLKRVEVEHETLAMNRFGIRAFKKGEVIVPTEIWPGSIAHKAGLEPDAEIIKVNGEILKDTLSDVLEKFIDEEIELTVRNAMKTKALKMKADERRFFPKQRIRKIQDATDEQKSLFEKWCGLIF